MNDDLMRLSDLVPEYASYYKVRSVEAAHGLHELIEDLMMEYCEVRGERLLPTGIFWVGRGESSQRSVKFYVLSYETLSVYFKNLYDPPAGIDSSLINCYCAADVEYRNIPAGVVYLSKAAFNKWVLSAGFKPPGFMLHSNTDNGSKENEGGKGLTTKELNTIGRIINGLIGVIKEVGKAYAEQPLDDATRRRAEAIKRAVYNINNPPRENSNLPLKLIYLADDAGVEMVKDPETLKRYMGLQSRSRRGT